MAAAAGGRPEDKKDAKSTFDFAAKMPELMGQARAGVEQAMKREASNRVNPRIGNEREANAKLALQRAVPDRAAGNAAIVSDAQLQSLSGAIKTAIALGKIPPNTSQETLSTSLDAALTAIRTANPLVNPSPLTATIHDILTTKTAPPVGRATVAHNYNGNNINDPNANQTILRDGIANAINSALAVTSEQKSISDNVGIGSTPNANSPLGKLNTRLTTMSNATGITDPVTQARLQNRITQINAAAKTLTGQAFSFGAEVPRGQQTPELKELKFTDAKPHIDTMQEGGAELKKVVAQRAHQAVAMLAIADSADNNRNNGIQGAQTQTQHAAAAAASYIRANTPDLKLEDQNNLASLAAGAAAQIAEANHAHLTNDTAAILGTVIAKEIQKSAIALATNGAAAPNKNNAIAGAGLAAGTEAIGVLQGAPVGHSVLQKLQAVEAAVHDLSETAGGTIQTARDLLNNNVVVTNNGGVLSTDAKAVGLYALVSAAGVTTTATPNEIARQTAALAEYNTALEAYCREMQTTADRLNKRAAAQPDDKPDIHLFRRNGIVPVDPAVALGHAAADPDRKPVGEGEFKVGDNKLPFKVASNGTVNFKPKNLQDCKDGLAIYLRKREESGGSSDQPMRIDTNHPQYLRWMVEAVAEKSVKVEPLSEARKKTLKDEFPKYKTNDYQGRSAEDFVADIEGRITAHNAAIDAQKQAVSDRVGLRR